MTDATDTLAAILAEMRKSAKDSYAEKTAKRLEDNEATGTRDALDIRDAIQCLLDDDKYLLDLADRIEAAAARERAITDVMLAVKDKPLPHPDPDNAPPLFAAPGNAAAMREALERIVGWCEGCHADACEKVCRPELTSESIHAALAAIAAPARNCDVGTAEEQAHRFHAFCSDNTSEIEGMCYSTCPCIDCVDKCHCLCVWSQMPFVPAKGGKE